MLSLILITCPVDGGNRFLQNVGTHLYGSTQHHIYGDGNHNTATRTSGLTKAVVLVMFLLVMWRVVIYWASVFTVKPGKGKGKTKDASSNSTTAGTGVTVLSEKKLFLGQKVRFFSN
jgi:hypothetical protein